MAGKTEDGVGTHKNLCQKTYFCFAHRLAPPARAWRTPRPFQKYTLRTPGRTPEHMTTAADDHGRSEDWLTAAAGRSGPQEAAAPRRCGRETSGSARTTRDTGRESRVKVTKSGGGEVSHPPQLRLGSIRQVGSILPLQTRGASIVKK